ncbi:MAG: hypothetical protein JNL11_06870 [Bdellovibrionaceae bacterium]|nr:hypothetical protein [Pseudobdellovibrionaceae bacterium]
MLSKWNLIWVLVVSMVMFVGCSTAYKQRQEERNKIASTSGHYCEFVNGDAHNDVDVELTMQMSKKCDMNKPYTLTNYKNASDIFGVIFCCGYQKGKATAAPNAKAASSASSNDGLE